MFRKSDGSSDLPEVPAEAVDITPEKAARLNELEGVIERGMHTFMDVGRALAEIQESRLYLRDFNTFEDYCRERWDLSKQYAHRQITAATVARELVPTGTAPRNEAVARELAPLRTEPNKLREAWQKILDQYGGQPTAAQVRGIIDTQYIADRTSDDDGEGPEVLNCPTCGHKVRASKLPARARAKARAAGDGVND